MPYPKSPFGDGFDTDIVWRRDGDDEHANVTVQNEILEWLCQTPKITTFRVNTLKSDVEDVLKTIKTHLMDTNVKIQTDPRFNEVITIHHPVTNLNLNIYEKEVIIDTICAAAVLRGAHIYAPGVLAMFAGTQTGDQVSIYADLAKKCKKGLAKLYTDTKVFIGNGIVKMERYQLYCENPQTGIAVQMIETISNCPSKLGDNFLQPGEALLQNLPSIVCVYALAPLPGDTILDMCASPGNKTTHIAALTNNQSTLIAIDKTPSKISRLKERCEIFGAKVQIIQADSTKLTTEKTFDKILLDAPCSALGQRPQLLNTTTTKVLRSYVPLQRKLFQNAVKLLKKGGTLVYSTCTITLVENEGIVAWALANFDIDLVKFDGAVGGSGFKGTNLTDEQLEKVQRFGPNQTIDSVGFFIAKFVKK